MNITLSMKSRSFDEMSSASLCICVLQIALDQILLVKVIASCMVLEKPSFSCDCNRVATSSRILHELFPELLAAATKHEQRQNWLFLLFLAL